MHLRPPLDPSADEARRLLRQELAKGKYGDHRGLVQRLFDWLHEQLQRIPQGTGGVPTGWLILALVVIAVLVLAGLTRVRRNRPAAATSEEGVLAGVDESAADLRAAAALAAERGDYSTAVVQTVRAMAKRGAERAIIDGRPGATAHEVTDELARAFPAQADGLRASARLFDDVRYGDRTASQADYRAVAGTEQEIDHARPMLATATADPAAGPTAAGPA